MDVPFKCSLWRITLPLTRRVSFLAVSHAFHKAHFVSDEKNLHCSFSLSSVKLAEQLLTSSGTGEAGDVFLSKIFTWLPGNNPLWRFLPRAYRNKVISVRSQMFTNICHTVQWRFNVRTCNSPSHHPSGCFLFTKISWPGDRDNCSADTALYAVVTVAISTITKNAFLDLYHTLHAINTELRPHNFI